MQHGQHTPHMCPNTGSGMAVKAQCRLLEGALCSKVWVRCVQDYVDFGGVQPKVVLQCSSRALFLAHCE